MGARPRGCRGSLCVLLLALLPSSWAFSLSGLGSVGALARTVPQIPQLRGFGGSQRRGLNVGRLSLGGVRLRGRGLSLSMEEEGMVASEGDVVGVVYKGTLDDGEVFDSNTDGGPLLEFEVGSGRVIKGFDLAVKGLKVGETRSVKCAPKDAYGELDERNVATVSKEQMPPPPDGMELQVGMVLQLTTGQIAVVKEIGEESVTLDGNHPLAGKTLNFEVTLKEIQDREKVLEQKIQQMDSMLQNPLMVMLASEITKDNDYIPNLRKSLAEAEDKRAAIREIEISQEWEDINIALMSNPQLQALMSDPEAVAKIQDGLKAEAAGGGAQAEEPAAAPGAAVEEAEFEKDA